jgi:hypothetical protein
MSSTRTRGTSLASRYAAIDQCCKCGIVDIRYKQIALWLAWPQMFEEPQMLSTTFAAIVDHRVDPNTTLAYMNTQLGDKWYGPMTKGDFLLCKWRAEEPTFLSCSQPGFKYFIAKVYWHFKMPAWR